MRFSLVKLATPKALRTASIGTLFLVVLCLTACGGSTEELLASARLAQQKGDYRTASEDLKDAVKGDPDSVEARIALARVSLIVGDFETAEWEFRAARRLGADERSIHLPYIESIFARSKFQLVIDEADLSLASSDEDRVVLLLTLGDAHRGLGSMSQAEARFREALEVDPLSLESHVKLARLMIRMGRLKECDHVVAQVLAIDKSYGPALVLRGVRETMEQRYVEAAATFDQVAANLVLQKPISPHTMGTLSDFATARQTLMSALVNAPEHRAAQKLLVAIDTIQGDLWEAANDSTAVVKTEVQPIVPPEKVAEAEPVQSAPEPVVEPKQPVEKPVRLDSPAAPEPAVHTVVKVEAMQLPAWVKRGSTRSPLQPGETLRPGDVVITGKRSQVLLRTQDGRRVTLKAKVQMDVGRILAGSGETVVDNNRLITGTGVLHDGGRWQVHLAAFAEPGPADSLVNLLRRAGVPAQRHEAQVTGKTWHRVQVRGFATQAGATKAASLLERSFGLPPPWVSRARDSS